MNENSTISIKDLVLLFWNHLWILILSLVVGAGAAYAYTTLAVDPQYSSHISMYVRHYICQNKHLPVCCSSFIITQK